MRQPTEFTSTYKEMTDTVRRCIRPCWMCEFKSTDACSHCPPSRVLKDLLGMLSYANKKLKEEGIVLSKKSKDDSSSSYSSASSHVRKEEKNYQNIWEELDKID